MNCIWFTLLRRAVPFAGLRLRLCRRHVEHCLRCQRESDSRETLPPLLLTAERLPEGLDLWPGVREGIVSRQKVAAGPEVIPLPPRRLRHWVYAAVMAALLLGTSFWIIFHGRRPEPQPGLAVECPAVQTRVRSARIENQPARIFLIQSRNPDRTIFWIAKNNI
jgi:hypothetical protein